MFGKKSFEDKRRIKSVILIVISLLFVSVSHASTQIDNSGGQFYGTIPGAEKSCFTSDGTYHVVYDGGNDVRYRNSSTNGSTWNEEVIVTTEINRYPGILCDSKDDLIIYGIHDSDQDFHFVNSSDIGAEWGTPYIPSASTGFTDIAEAICKLDSRNNIHCVVLEENNDSARYFNNSATSSVSLPTSGDDADEPFLVVGINDLVITGFAGTVSDDVTFSASLDGYGSAHAMTQFTSYSSNEFGDMTIDKNDALHLAICDDSNLYYCNSTPITSVSDLDNSNWDCELVTDVEFRNCKASIGVTHDGDSVYIFNSIGSTTQASTDFSLYQRIDGKWIGGEKFLEDIARGWEPSISQTMFPQWNRLDDTSYSGDVPADRIHVTFPFTNQLRYQNWSVSPVRRIVPNTNFTPSQNIWTVETVAGFEVPSNVPIDSNDNPTKDSHMNNVCRDPSGNWHMAFDGNETDDLIYLNSNDNGNTWENTQNIDKGTIEDVNILCKSNGDLQIVYENGNDIDVYNSTDSGSTWVQDLDFANGLSFQEPSCELDSNDVTHCCFRDTSSDLIYYANSSSWGNYVETLSHLSGEGNMESCNLVVDENDNIYLIQGEDDGDDFFITNSQSKYQTQVTFVNATSGNIQAQDIGAVYYDGHIYVAGYNGNNNTWCQINADETMSVDSCKTYQDGTGNNGDFAILSDGTVVILGSLSNSPTVNSELEYYLGYANDSDTFTRTTILENEQTNMGYAGIANSYWPANNRIESHGHVMGYATHTGAFQKVGVWYTTESIVDCIYLGYRDWVVNAGSNCVIDSIVDLGGNSISVFGSGAMTVTSKLVNFTQFAIHGINARFVCENQAGCFH